MSLPVSQYEELLAEVRGLRRRAQRVQRLADPFLAEARTRHRQQAASNLPLHTRQPPAGLHHHHKHYNAGGASSAEVPVSLNGAVGGRERYTMDSVVLHQHDATVAASSSAFDRLDNGGDGGISSEEDGCHGTHMSVSSEPVVNGPRPVSMLYHGTWPVERTMWNSEPANLVSGGANQCNAGLGQRMHQPDMTSVMSFASSSGAVPLDHMLGQSPGNSRRSSQQLEVKMDMVYSLLSMLGGQEHADMGDTLLALSASPESSLAMRQSGCIPLLVQMVHSDRDAETRRKAVQALHNLVQCQPDEKLLRRETRVLKLLEQLRAYSLQLLNPENEEAEAATSAQTDEETDKHPVQTIAHLMKLSFDEAHRQAICQLGGIHVIAQLIEMEHMVHHSLSEDQHCVTMRRYANMALTNLTFGDGGNKALLCSFKNFMKALVAQLQNNSDELRQVTASVLRNLSWRADSTSKEILKEVGTVKGLMTAAMIESSKEATLKSILSALWNLSAHCSENKAEICSVEGALGFLVDMLSYKTPSKSLAIIENSGGILRNISSHIAVNEDYRAILREHNCLQVLLEQLKSPSLTIVSNACGTLWNLSAKCPEDQNALWEMGAAPMLRSLNHSKHKMIAMGSSAALKNLLSSRPSHSLFTQLDTTAKAMDLPVLPTLGARKQKALVQELDQNLAETCENIEPVSPKKTVTPLHVANTDIKGKETFVKQETENSYIPAAGYAGKQSISQLNATVNTSIVSSADISSDGETTLTQSFANLSIMSSGASNSSNTNRSRASSRSRIPQSATSGFGTSGSGYNSSSLPYSSARSRTPSTYIPIRNKYADCEFEDENDCNDLPIDYSQKFVETRTETRKTAVNSECFAVNADYAETDLDQPTDYSLRYAENDSDSEADLCKVPERKYVPLESEDTLKTYCTEGTPYETPFNFSTATSMSDLREVGAAEKDATVIDNDKSSSNIAPKSKGQDTKTPNLSHLDEKDHCSIEDITELENDGKHQASATSVVKVKSEFSSGMMSPEKPVNYCDEGTPGYFSRVSSFGSLNSIPLNEATAISSNSRKNGAEGAINTPGIAASGTEKERVSEETDLKNESQGEAKVVTFGRVIDYAEETPLMFSRSSSLGSLGSIEQHSIHDDRSSVVSDFSRLTSGVVSPSELPDSPTQTVPPSPRQRKAPMDYSATGSSKVRPQPAPRNLPKASVFEDNIIKFKEESTPAQFSTATSLSSLTIDDEVKITRDDLPSLSTARRRLPTADNSPLNMTNASDNSTQGSSGGDSSSRDLEEMEKQDIEQEKNIESETESCVALSEGEEGDDDILAACINIGMQNNRHRENKHQNSPQEKSLLPQHSTPYASSKYQMKTGIPSVKSSSSNIPQTSHVSSTSRNLHTQQPPLQMVNVRRSDATFTQDTVLKYCTEDTPGGLSYAGSHSDLSILSFEQEAISSSKTDREKLQQQQEQKQQNAAEFSDDSSNLSVDHESMLEECIQSAMPKAKPKSTATSTPNVGSDRVLSREDLNKRLSGHALPPYLAAKDEVESYAVENSPCHFSLRSSLSDLTVDGSTAGLKRPTPAKVSPDQSTCYENSPSENNRAAYYDPTERVPRDSDVDAPANLSRQPSLSSLSVESFGSVENAEQALLEQCISSGMPKSNKPKTTSVPSVKPIHPNSQESAYQRRQAAAPGGANGETESKNGLVASAAKNTATIAAAAAVDGPDAKSARKPERNRSPTEENLLIAQMKSGFEDRKQLGALLDNSIEDNETPDQSRSGLSLEENLDETNFNLVGSRSVDTRMLDPDAMIESLDRFTAELVSQSSHLQSRYVGGETANGKSNGEDGDTWSEDTCPNDVSFPTVSGSAPQVVTFQSETEQQNIQKNNANVNDNDCKQPKSHLEVEIISEYMSNNFSSLSSSTMTESTLIAIEATKMAAAFKTEAEMAHSVTSIGSLELDNIRPPSNMNSLTSSFNGNGSELQKRTAPKAVTRKRSLPSGLMARRALINSQQQTSSLESLSNLDHVNPPSAMGELDLMENSMISVASITSEIAEDKSFDGFDTQTVTLERTSSSLPCQIQQPNPIFDVKQPNNMLHLFTSSTNSISNIENINPPSLFNDVTDMYNSLADIATDTICNTTDMFEDCNTHVVETTADEVSEFSDAGSVTPIQSDFGSSSAENTPKKAKNINKRLTPKQRRTLAKERYKTYTVAAEMVIKEEAQRMLGEREQYDVVEDMLSVTTEEYVTGNDHSSLNSCTTVTLTNEVHNSTGTNSGSKMTPKERRQNDRARFQTQVLDEATTAEIKRQAEIASACAINGSVSNFNANVPKSPSKSRISVRKNFVQKRFENQDRFRTQTISESSLSPEISASSPPLSDSGDIHHLLAKGANVVLSHLNQTKSNGDDFLECETLSLVSNDDESEHNSASSMGYRTFRKSCSYSRNIPVINPQSVPPPSPKPEPAIEEPEASEEEDEIENRDYHQQKPRIVKPNETIVVSGSEEHSSNDEEKAKGIRGKRKTLYVSPYRASQNANSGSKIVPKSIKPIKTMTSNLVRNVTSTLRSSAGLKQNKTQVTKPVLQPTVQSRNQTNNMSKPPIGHPQKNAPRYGSSPKTLSPNRMPASKKPESPKRGIPAPLSSKTAAPPLPLERQGTFTKEDQDTPTAKPQTKIPLPSEKKSKIAKVISSNASVVGKTVSKLQNMIHPTHRANSASVTPTVSARNGLMKSASADRANRTIARYSDRSPSVDRVENGIAQRKPSSIHYSSSSQSLKSNDGSGGTVKRSSIPSMTPRSNSNTSITSNGSGKKLVTSKIASLWKRVEESKKNSSAQKKADTRVWIGAPAAPVSSPDSTTPFVPPQLIRSNTFESKPKNLDSTFNETEVVLRKPKVDKDVNNGPKRVSRLGSFIQMDERNECISNNHVVSTTPDLSF